MPSDKFPDNKKEVLLPSLSERENEIVSKLNIEQKQQIKAWHKNNLTKDKKEIVATRAEDLLYFFECVQKGHIPVGAGVLRAKYKGDFFFVTPNPESEDLLHTRPDSISDQPYSISGELPKTLNDTIHENREYYQVANMQAIYRNFVNPYLSDLNAFERLASDFIKKNRDIILYKPGVSDPIETYLTYLMYDMDEIRIDCFNAPRRNPALFHLGEYLKSKDIDIKPLRDFLMKMGHRGSICLAFNKKLIEQYSATSDPYKTDAPGEEFVVEVPDGKLSLDTVHGFEVLGDFEDDVLEKLEI